MSNHDAHVEVEDRKHDGGEKERENDQAVEPLKQLRIRGHGTHTDIRTVAGDSEG